MARLTDQKPVYWDNSSPPQILAGGTITFYLTGTSTLTNVYTDAALTTPANNPQTLDSDGRVTQNIFMDSSVTYRVLLKDSAGATISDVSGCTFADPAQLTALVADVQDQLDTLAQDVSGESVIINGSMLVDQRATGTTPLSLTTSYQYTVDRMAAGVLNSVTAGTVGKTTNAVIGSAAALVMSGVSGLSTAQPSIRYRVEAKDAAALSNQTVTFAMDVYQNAVSSCNYVITLSEADASDDFTTVTTTGITSTTAVLISTATTISVTGTLGDVSNGLQITVTAQPGAALTTKNFYWSDMRLSRSSIVLPFSPRPYGQELSLCKRYYQLIVSGTGKLLGSGYSSGVNNFFADVNINQMRTDVADSQIVLSNKNHFVVNVVGGADVGTFDSSTVRTGYVNDISFQYTFTKAGAFTTKEPGTVVSNDASASFAVNQEL